MENIEAELKNIRLAITDLVNISLANMPYPDRAHLMGDKVFVLPNEADIYGLKQEVHDGEA
jgi:hypothetical protein